MKPEQFYSRISSRVKWHSLPERRPPLMATERARQFLQAIPLVLIPAMFALPTWLVLIHQNRFPNARPIGFVLLPTLMAMTVIGSRKLLRCIDWKTLDLIGAMAFGAFLVLGVMSLYAIVFFIAYFHGDLP